MEVIQAPLLSLLDGKKQFTIPIYQRTYSWKSQHCQQLFADIERVGKSAKDSHFLGSVIYFKPDHSPITSVPELLVIDGQQRLASVSLLLLALVHFLKENKDVTLEDESWEEIQETYLVNRHKADDYKYKLLLTRRDKETFTKLIDGSVGSNGASEMNIEKGYSKRVLENYKFFKEKLHRENIQTIFFGIKRLLVIDVILERGKDNPQLIFESLNSTGLGLSQADLIRNYVLMDQTLDLQNRLYEKYWYPMEQIFGENLNWIAKYIRDYLTMKQSEIPKIDAVYETYKQFLKSENGLPTIAIEAAIKSLYKYAVFYVRIALSAKQDAAIAKKLKEIDKLKIETCYPFLLAVYGDYEEEKITKGEFIEIIGLISNYAFRRAICGIPPNSLNKTFAILYKSIKHETYLESIKAAFLLMSGYKRFPTDAEFREELQVKDVHNFRSRNYLLESLENWQRKELVNVENYTIEHILPQNQNISLQWQAELGEDWGKVKETYLHTLGNLTLTGYNSELSDRPFAEKKKIAGGFATSPLYLNESVRNAATWNADAILSRASTLAERACTIWKRPALSKERLEFYKEKEQEKNNEQEVYSLEDYVHLEGDMLDLYKSLEKRILNLDTSVRIEFKKLYIAFKSQSNFVDVVPQKSGLRLSLNTRFDTIKDPKGFCVDISELGRWGNGDVEVRLERVGDLDYVITLIEQVLEEQIGI